MTVAVRLAAASLITLALGPPILETWEAFVLGAALLAVVMGNSRRGWWRLPAAVAVVVVLVGLRVLLPRADIAEAHNPFMVIAEGEALQRGLPEPVFASWKAQFDALYPQNGDSVPPAYSWRTLTRVPTALYARSADAIWRRAKYTRQVDHVDFRSLGEFRGGFANDMYYNFWEGDLSRATMPFYVMYELSPDSVGSRLEWQGQLFWERSGGDFEEIHHPEPAARAIAPEDAGRLVYAAFFPKRDQRLHFRLLPSLILRLSAIAGALLTAVCVLMILALTIQVRWRTYLRLLLIFAVGYGLVMGFALTRSGVYLGASYPPHGGGDDGLFHDSVGREMSFLAGQGDAIEAMKGTEAVYWFTPGMRYFRMVEKLLFGDTNHLYTLVLAGVPVVVLLLFGQFVSGYWAHVLTLAFCCLLVGNPSLYQYVDNATLGYGEALGGVLFLYGLVALLRTREAWGGDLRSPLVVWTGGAALAGSMFVRPNFALAVVWLGVAYAWASVRSRDSVSVVALGLGLGLALWMPLHNVFYGGAFYLISKAGATISVPIGVGDYGAAIGDVVQGRVDTPAIDVIAGQLEGWLLNPGFIPTSELSILSGSAHAIRLLALLVTCWVALCLLVRRTSRKEAGVGVVAVAAILAHIPMLFVFNTAYRYAMLGWDLSIVVLIVSGLYWSKAAVTLSAPQPVRHI